LFLKTSYQNPAVKSFLKKAKVRYGDLTVGDRSEQIWFEKKGAAACLFHRAWESGILKESRWGLKGMAGKSPKELASAVVLLPQLFHQIKAASVAVRVPMGSHAFVQLLEKTGFHYVGGLVTLKIASDRLKEFPPNAPGNVNIRSAQKKDLAPLKNIAREAFREGRFYHEPGLKKGAAQKIYGVWAQNMLNYADEVKVAGEKSPLGFVSLKEDGPHQRLWIDLIAVAPGSQGRGIGSVLVEESRKAALRRPGWSLGVKTEPENLGALRFYLGNGFDPESFQLDYIWRS
jgi:dTDP-4-amino-4,6-dideoxy-D-galactose acyltransferase